MRLGLHNNIPALATAHAPPFIDTVQLRLLCLKVPWYAVPVCGWLLHPILS